MTCKMPASFLIPRLNRAIISSPCYAHLILCELHITNPGDPPAPARLRFMRADASESEPLVARQD